MSWRWAVVWEWARLFFCVLIFSWNDCDLFKNAAAAVIADVLKRMCISLVFPPPCRVESSAELNVSGLEVTWRDTGDH